MTVLHYIQQHRYPVFVKNNYTIELSVPRTVSSKEAIHNILKTTFTTLCEISYCGRWIIKNLFRGVVCLEIFHNSLSLPSQHIPDSFKFQHLSVFIIHVSKHCLTDYI